MPFPAADIVEEREYVSGMLVSLFVSLFMSLRSLALLSLPRLGDTGRTEPEELGRSLAPLVLRFAKSTTALAPDSILSLKLFQTKAPTSKPLHRELRRRRERR